MVATINVDDLKQRLSSSGVVLDIRTAEEWAQGVIQTAILTGRDHLESQVMATIHDKNQPLYLICRSGQRSGHATHALLALGYTKVYSVDGGMQAWQAKGYDVVMPDKAMSDRYARQVQLPLIGEQGQKKLLSSKVLVLGLGGLGCPVVQYLAGAGVGQLVVVDDDRVERHNLHRQILYADHQIGQTKSEASKQRVMAYNPDVQLIAHAATITQDKLANWVKGMDIVIECTDQLINRYWLNEVCAQQGVPWVYGSVDQFSGQVALFEPGGLNQSGMCYQCLYPKAPVPGAVKSCAESGVLGVLPGTIGLLQATEALKWLLGLPHARQSLIVYDALRLTVDKIRLQPSVSCYGCAAK